jgi:hypothetical protein
MIIHSLSPATVAKQEGEVNVSARDCLRKPYSLTFFPILLTEPLD